MQDAKKEIKKTTSLKKNFSWTLIGNLIYAACQWGILIVLAQFGSPEMVGAYGLALAITAPIILLFNLQLRSIQATDTKDMYLFGDYLSLRLISSVIALTLIIFIVYFGDFSISTGIVVIVIGISKFIESISDVIYGLAQKKEYMNLIAISRIVKGIISFGSFSITIWLTENLILSVLALCLMWLLVLLIFDLKIARRFEKIKPLMDFKKIFKIFKLSLPLGIVVMLGSLNSNIPRYFLEYYFNSEYLGYFTALAYLIIVGDTMINALGQAATPRLANYYSKNNKKMFFSLILKLVGFAVCIGISGILITFVYGEEILTIIYGKEYGDFSNVFIIIMLAGAFGYIGSFIGYGITAARFFKIQPFLGVIWIMTSLIGSYYLIPEYGISGAAYTLVLTAFVQVILKGSVLFYLKNLDVS